MDKILSKLFLYSGAKFICKKFVPNKSQPYPNGWIWLIGIYFAMYAFSSQRYEQQLNRLEFRYSIFSNQIAAGGVFSNDILMGILNGKIPIEPKVHNPLTVLKSFVYGPFYKQYFSTHGDKFTQKFSNAEEFRQQLIRQWHKKLHGANFIVADNLKDANFLWAESPMGDFSFAELENADFSYSNLEGASFMNAKLKKVKFIESNLTCGDFLDANIVRGIFKGSNLEDTSFFYANLESANFEDVSNLTIEQLIVAANLKNIKGLPGGMVKKFKDLGLGAMLHTTPETWDDSLKTIREKYIKAFLDIDTGCRDPNPDRKP